MLKNVYIFDMIKNLNTLKSTFFAWDNKNNNNFHVNFFVVFLSLIYILLTLLLV